MDPVHYPGAVTDPDTGELISDAEVAEIAYTAFAGTPDQVTARLIVRRVRDANTQDALFPVWRYHPFFTNTTEPVSPGRHHPPRARHHRNRLVRPDRRTLGPPALRARSPPTPPGRMLAAITHNLLRAAGTLTGSRPHAVARGATLRRHLINVPARLARPQRRPVLHLPAHWPRAHAWLGLWTAVFGP